MFKNMYGDKRYTIAELAGTPFFSFYISGLRLFNNRSRYDDRLHQFDNSPYRDEFDYDFFAQDSAEIRTWLESKKFKHIQFPEPVLDSMSTAMYQLYDQLLQKYVRVILTENDELRETVQKVILFQYPQGFNDNNELVHVWRHATEVITAANQLEEEKK